ncbi:hypothetical protein [Demequina gelatinilytica]|uniref:hypothetical protein n=1 Tax=Demequina gelatinilytica TaxID=1638980 RepID=UPI0007843D48|nr:hypothetical protein [Demequina gelatinilytica]
MHSNSRARAQQGPAPLLLERTPRESEWIAESTFISEPHPFAMLGHQVSSWLSGLLWTRDLGGRYLGGTMTQNDPELLRLPVEPGAALGRTVRLPAVRDERDPGSAVILANAVTSAVRRRRGPCSFMFALDQLRYDQTPASEALRQGALNGVAGDRIRRLESEPPYVALHMRRGDIDPNAHAARWVLPEWYAEVIAKLQSDKAVAATRYLVFTQGAQAAEELRDALPGGVEVIGDGTRESDFAHMVAARLLVPAPSSFSFTAALASRGAVLARSPWWHEIPDAGRWVPLTSGGDYEAAALARAMNSTVAS